MRSRFAPTLITLLLAWLGSCGLETDALGHTSQYADWQTECIGYFSLKLPGAVEHGSARPRGMTAREVGWGFTASRVPAWGMSLDPDPGITDEDARERSLYISKLATFDELRALMNDLNSEQERQKQLLLEQSARWAARPKLDPDGTYARDLLQQAASLRFYKLLPDVQAIADDDGKMTTFYVLIKDRIIKARRPTSGSAANTVDEFLKHYSARETFSIPAEPGACLPYGFYRGEKEPAYVGATMTLVQRPDIVINLTFSDASNVAKAPKVVLTQILRFDLVRAVEVLPLDGRLRPSREIEVDGQTGLGHFALVRREDPQPDSPKAKANPYTKDHSDWVYVAYIPGHPGGKPGESFNIEARIERFGRFAKEPAGKQMTEKQFRAMALQIMQSIHRRPGAWVVRK